jgi:hypothetical protein
MHWLGQFIVEKIKHSYAMNLAQLDDILRSGWVDGDNLKPTFLIIEPMDG